MPTTMLEAPATAVTLQYVRVQNTGYMFCGTQVYTITYTYTTLHQKLFIGDKRTRVILQKGFSYWHEQAFDATFFQVHPQPLRYHRNLANAR